MSRHDPTALGVAPGLIDLLDRLHPGPGLKDTEI
jgi:hypothetical protein